MDFQVSALSSSHLDCQRSSSYIACEKRLETVDTRANSLVGMYYMENYIEIRGIEGKLGGSKGARARGEGDAHGR